MRLGILGGGQLGRMLALSARPLGHAVTVLEADEGCPASVAARVLVAPYTDQEGLRALAAASDVVTCEFESVPAEALAYLAELGVPVRPSPEAFRVASDRLLEKSFFRDLGIRTAPFEAVDDEASLRDAVSRIGLPAVLKTRRNGYDGKGQRVLRDEADVVAAAREFAGVPVILEGFVSFRRELSVVAVRALSGAIRTYPLVENVHRSGILHTTRAPAPGVADATAADAERLARAALERLDYVGVLAIELFDTDAGLLVNEMAPRVHNSGHWTQDGAATSQFENHVRAVTGVGLGPTHALAPTTMVNLVGSSPPADAILAVEGAHLHLYDKAPRAGRKVGHVNVVGADPAPVVALVEAASDG